MSNEILMREARNGSWYTHPMDERTNEDDSRLVTVLTAGNGGQIAHASSILEEAGIPYFEKGGVSRRLGIYLFNASARFVEFQTAHVDAATARKLLAKNGLKPD
ncbi:MAG: hypothetical protein U9Q94_06070 [Candidatus Bipolaricaulota bacterium]|nr:hypothetical protein [Candidatus Bipolaricaulota bacterium]